MGWSYGISISGKEIGYAVEAECDYPSCKAKINRGLAYACGGNHEAGDDYCDKYFCYGHLVNTPAGFRCPECAKLNDEEVAKERYDTIDGKWWLFDGDKKE